MKQLIATGVAGPAYLTTVETAWRRRTDYYAVSWRGKWATERAGALLADAFHNHDLLCYVLGPARRLSAYTTARVNPIEVEGCASIAMEMAAGSPAALGLTLGSVDEVNPPLLAQRTCRGE